MMGTSRTGPVGVAVVGCGSVSRHYLRTLRWFEVLEVVACADIDPARAKSRVAEFGLGRPATVEDVLADDAVEVVVNLTPPTAHAHITRMCLSAGRSVYSEKPLAPTWTEGRELVALAEQRGLLLACAPDTMLGRGVQTVRHLMESGAIGQPIYAQATFAVAGHEVWHPDPQYYYLPGAGPLWDMGPYYLSLLISLLGPITSVQAHETRSPRVRQVATGPQRGARVRVETPTTSMALLRFTSSAAATLVCSFDGWATAAPRLEVQGSDAAVLAADPNTFGGPVHMATGTSAGWSEVDLVEGYDLERGIGVADLAAAVRHGGQPRASAELALHVVEVMAAVASSSATGGRTVPVNGRPVVPPLVPDLSTYGWTPPDPTIDARYAVVV
jgi:predicted dehydrogenase